MSSENKSERGTGSDPESSSPGINLKLIYSLIALALLAAIAIALRIVLPFYHR